MGQKGYDDNTKSADFERKPLVKCLDQTTTETDDPGSSSGTRAPIAIRKEEIAKIAKWKERAEQTTMRSAKVLHRARLRERLYLEETMRGSIPECMLFVGILACYASVLFIRVNPAVMLHTVRTPGRASCRCCPPASVAGFCDASLLYSPGRCARAGCGDAMRSNTIITACIYNSIQRVRIS